MPGVDGLRALAVTMVLVFHIYGFGAGSPQVTLMGWLNLAPWLSTGYLGVDLFFALSGFLLMLPWTKSHYQGLPKPQIRTYFWRRFYRIAPAYYVQIACLFFIFVPIALADWSNLSKLGLFTIFTHVTFTHYLFPVTSSGLGINGALWTLTIEACFYLALPFMARYFVGPKAWRSLLFALILAETWKYLSFHQMYDFLVWLTITVAPKMAAYRYEPIVLKMFLANQFPSQIFNFAIGMYCASLYYSMTPGVRRLFEGGLGGVTTLLLLGLLAFLAWQVGRLDVWGGSWLYVWFIGVAAISAGLVLLASFKNTVSDKVLGAAPVRLLGIISYSVYLWHFPVIYFAKNYWMPAEVTGLNKFYWMLAVCVPITLIISYISYRYVELPFLTLAKNISRGQK